jgi:hypothetical protein
MPQFSTRPADLKRPLSRFLLILSKFNLLLGRETPTSWGVRPQPWGLRPQPPSRKLTDISQVTHINFLPVPGASGPARQRCEKIKKNNPARTAKADATATRKQNNGANMKLACRQAGTLPVTKSGHWGSRDPPLSQNGIPLFEPAAADIFIFQSRRMAIPHALTPLDRKPK